MSKPLPSQTTFAPLSPPWSLTSLDANFTNLWGAVNDIGTYSNVFADTGAVNAMTVTVTAPVTFALVDGVTLDVNVGHTTTVTNPTLNVASTGAKTIVNADNTALAIGQLVLGTRVRMLYDAANTVWRVTSQTNGVPVLASPVQATGPVAAVAVDMTPDKGTFTGTLTGMTGGTTGTVNWVRMGNVAQIYVVTGFVGTSNSTSMTMTGLPAALTPANGGNICACSLTDNGNGGTLGAASVSGTTITFYRATAATPPVFSPNSFTNTGNKGVVSGWLITYPLA